jgi:hypothetical protein
VDGLTRLRVLVLVGVMALGACGGGGGPVAEPAALPGATPYPRDVDLITRSQLAMADLRSRLQEHYDSPWEASRYEIAGSVQWDAVAAHYGQALGQDWQVDARYQEDAGLGYRSRVWTDGDHAVAIALADGPATSDVLTVLWPDEE